MYAVYHDGKPRNWCGNTIRIPTGAIYGRDDISHFVWELYVSRGEPKLHILLNRLDMNRGWCEVWEDDTSPIYHLVMQMMIEHGCKPKSISRKSSRNALAEVKNKKHNNITNNTYASVHPSFVADDSSLASHYDRAKSIVQDNATMWA